MIHDPIDFALGLRLKDLPDRAVSDALRGLTDTLGVAVAASDTALSRIVRDHAAQQFGAGEGAGAVLWQDGRRVSPAGAALANGMTIDALDAHDGSKPTKGHVGCGVVATALATAGGCTGAELIARIAAGYEIGTRAGIALHATARDFHTSGAWIALACAVMTSRALGLDPAQAREAMGIAEYHGPRSQMMRCIDHPTMVKDGSGWGAMAGVSAAYLARDGFTGAPALTVEGADVAGVWADLGERWYVSEQYIKLYPVCRWAQPAVEAALALMRDHALAPADVASVRIDTFHEAARLTAIPATTEQAQYSLPFSVAAAIRHGTIGVAEVGADGLSDAGIRDLARRVRMTERAAFNDAFPARRFAVAEITLADGRTVTSDVTEARGDPEAPLPAAEIEAKFDRLTAPVIGAARARDLRCAIADLPGAPSTDPLVAAMAQAPT
ncbi:MAG: MmgE/PrpD family protein [Paracoccaceae bacterium]